MSNPVPPDPSGVMIVSNWFIWAAGTIISGLSAALVYLFHNKADRAELSTALQNISNNTADMRADIRQLRDILLRQHND